MRCLLSTLLVLLLTGKTWTDPVESISTGPAVRYGVNTLALDLHNPQILYAAGRTDGLFKSIDGGHSWEAVWIPSFATVSGNTVQIDPVVEDIVVDPHHAEVVYIKVAREGILKSIDGGKTWIALPFTLPGNAGVPSFLEIDPLQPDVIFAGNTGFERGWFRSTDGGITWTQVLSEPVSTVIRSQQTPQVLYALNDFNTALFKSFDGGINWTLVSAEMPLRFPALAVDPKNPEVIYMGGVVISEDIPTGVIFKSMDSGATWTEVFKIPDAMIRSLAVDPHAPHIVYAGSAGKISNTGLFRSTNGGKSWEKINTYAPMTIAIDPQETNTVYVGMMIGGVFRFTFSDRNTAIQQATWGKIKKNH